MTKFAVLAAPDSWYARDLSRAAGSRHEIVVVPFSQISASIAENDRWLAPDRSHRRDNDRLAPGRSLLSDDHVCSGGHDLAGFDAILVRTMPPGSLEQVVFRMDALGQLAAAGKLIVNPPRALETAVDKYLTLARLRAAGLLTPHTWVGQIADEALVAWEQLGKDVVVKPLFGSEGRGMMRITDPDLAHRAFTALERLGAVIYLQEFIAHQGHDLRLFVLGDCTLGMKRSSSQDWRTNVSRGATTEPLRVTDELSEIALRANTAIGTMIAGVDLLPSLDGRLYAIEVNAVPGWRALAKTLDVDIASQVLEFVASRK